MDSAIAALNITAVQPLTEALPLHGLAGSAVPVSALPVGSIPVGAVAALQMPDPAVLNSPAQQDPGMHSRVSGLAQAISAFVPVDAVASNAPVASLASSGVSTFTNTPVALAVVSMVDVMKQFDANGNQLVSGVSAAPSSTKSLTVPGLNDLAANGLLATGGKA